MNFDWSRVVNPSGPSVRPEQLEEFEAVLGFDLPKDYRNFLLKFNGGKVVVDHDIEVRELPFELGVHYLLPLTASSPSMGVIETRDIQVRHRLCSRQVLEIADDMGTGCYYLVLAGENRGAVYFIWNEDRPMLSPADWDSWEVRIPSDMVEISSTFDALGQLILEYQCGD
jgi:hypothetical protein